MSRRLKKSAAQRTLAGHLCSAVLLAPLEVKDVSIGASKLYDARSERPIHRDRRAVNVHGRRLLDDNLLLGRQDGRFAAVPAKHQQAVAVEEKCACRQQCHPLPRSNLLRIGDEEHVVVLRACGRNTCNCKYCSPSHCKELFHGSTLLSG